MKIFAIKASVANEVYCFLIAYLECPLNGSVNSSRPTGRKWKNTFTSFKINESLSTIFLGVEQVKLFISRRL